MAWNSVSPSQIENFQKCKRLWFLKSIQKIPETQRGHQALGTAFHLIMERIPQGLTYDHSEVQTQPGDWTKAEAMADVALPLLPGMNGKTPDMAIASRIVREQAIQLPTYPGGPRMIGYVDLGVPVGIGWPAFLVPANEAIVGDYKTLSDFRYMRTPEELANSVQMMTYGKWAIEGLSPNELPEYIRLLHMYARTKPPFNRNAVRYSSAIVTPDQINEKWENTLDVVREMATTSLCSSHEDVEAGGALNGHCEAYGGCSFRDKCGIVKASGIKSLFSIGKKPQTQENTTMSGSPIMERIKAAQAKARAASAGQDPTPAPTADVSATGAGGASAPAPSIQTPTGLTSAASPAPVAGAAGIVPPDAPSRAQSVITRPGDAVADPEAEKPVASEEDEESEDVGATATPANAGPSAGAGNSTSTPGDSGAPTNVAEAAKAASSVAGKRGRPSNAELAAREAAKKAEFDALVLAKAKELGGSVEETQKLRAELEMSGQHKLAMSAELAKMEDLVKTLRQDLVEARKGAPAPAPQIDGLTLYVDCLPTKGDRDVTDFYEWIGPICAAVAKANSVEDYRLINYTSKGLLAAAIRATIREQGLPKAITVQTFAGGADIALEVLTPLAKRVIKKV